jgi:type IV pilus assembly protein PilF
MTAGGRVSAVLLILAVMGCTSSGGVMPSNLRNAAAINAELGLAYMEQGNEELAMDKLQLALKQDPESADAHHYIAQLYMKLGKNGEAEEHYRKALSLSPANPMLLNNYGVFLCGQKRLAEAEKKFLEAVKQPFYKAPEMAYNNAGLCALQVPDPVKAEEYFRDALRVNPRMPDALYSMADLKFKQRDYFYSRAFLQRYLEVAPATPAILWLGVRMERGLGNEASAAKYAKQLQDEFPMSQETALLRGQQAP